MKNALSIGSKMDLKWPQLTFISSLINNSTGFPLELFDILYVMSTCPCCNMTWFLSAWFLHDCCARSRALFLKELTADEYLLEKLWAGDFKGDDDRPKVFDNRRILLKIRLNLEISKFSPFSPNCHFRSGWKFGCSNFLRNMSI